MHVMFLLNMGQGTFPLATSLSWQGQSPSVAILVFLPNQIIFIYVLLDQTKLGLSGHQQGQT